MDSSVLGGIAIILGVTGAAVLWQQKYGNGGPKKSKKMGNDSFMLDLIAEAKAGKLDPFSEREEEVERTIHILLRRLKNNPLLIGEPGVGKTAIVHGLAQRIASGDVPKSLQGKSLYAINLAALFGETKYRGELEKRVQDFLSSLEGKSRDTILFIDEVHMIVQAGNSEGSLNITELFKPALSRGDLQIIGATTWNEYAKYIKPDSALERRFQPVLVDEPTNAQAVRMLKTLRPEYEKFHGVKIPDESLKAAVDLSSKYIKGRFLPDKALDLIDEAGAKVSIEAAKPTHTKHLGVIHGASKNAKRDNMTKTVTVADVTEVVDQWREHAKAASKR